MVHAVGGWAGLAGAWVLGPRLGKYRADGTPVAGPVALRNAILARPDAFVQTLTEKLMMYALGRNVQYYDAPAIRRIVRESAANHDEFSAIVQGLVASVPGMDSFQLSFWLRRYHR